MRHDRGERRIQAAVAELEHLIAERYPDARFHVAPGPEDPREVHLVATVDLDDPDEVLDVVLERMLQFQLEEELPVYVSPRRTAPRRAQLWAAQRHRSALPPIGPA